jgi:hypothetical protein
MAATRRRFGAGEGKALVYGMHGIIPRNTDYALQWRFHLESEDVCISTRLH